MKHELGFAEGILVVAINCSIFAGVLALTELGKRNESGLKAIAAEMRADREQMERGCASRPEDRAAALADVKERHDAQARSLLKTNGSWVEGLTHKSFKADGTKDIPGVGKVAPGSIIWQDLATGQYMTPQKSGR